jgi:YVTN family beta-propeller protein
MPRLRCLCGLLACLVLAGCASIFEPIRRRAPLENEGELIAELEPLAAPHEALSFEVGAVWAVRSDGEEFALEPGVRTITGRDRRSHHRLAGGRLPPGQYSGFKVKIAKATLAQEEGRPSELLVADTPDLSPAPFEILARRISLLSVQVLPASLVDRYAFRPVLHAIPRPRTMPVALGCVTSSGEDLLSLFDKNERQRTEVLPLGQGPWGVALDPLARRAYVALSEEDRIAVLDLGSGTEVGQIRMAPGDAPRELALAPDRKTLLSANSGSGTVSFLDAAAQVELARVPAGDEPSALLLDRIGRRAYAFSTRSNTVTVLDLASRSKVQQLATEAPPLRGALDRSGSTLYVAMPGTAWMVAYSTTDYSVQRRIYIGLGASALMVDPATDLLYVGRDAEQRLDVFDPFSPMPIDVVDLPASPSLLTIDDAQNALFVLLPGAGALAVLDLATRRLQATFDVGTAPKGLALIGERR